LDNDRIALFKKNGTKFNENNEYKDQIEYKILTLTRVIDPHIVLA